MNSLNFMPGKAKHLSLDQLQFWTSWKFFRIYLVFQGTEVFSLGKQAAHNDGGDISGSMKATMTFTGSICIKTDTEMQVSHWIVYRLGTHRYALHLAYTVIFWEHLQRARVLWKTWFRFRLRYVSRMLAQRAKYDNLNINIVYAGENGEAKAQECRHYFERYFFLDDTQKLYFRSITSVMEGVRHFPINWKAARLKAQCTSEAQATAG